MKQRSQLWPQERGINVIPVAAEKKPPPAFKRVDIEIPLYQQPVLAMAVPKDPSKLLFGKTPRPVIHDRAEYDSEYNGQEEEDMLKSFCGPPRSQVGSQEQSEN